jgi:hypothetical protein
MTFVGRKLIERLLYESEGDALDFKRDQYPFVGATDEQKSDLLKDILAFANSWRRTDAFALHRRNARRDHRQRREREQP